jgi:hypothetical protein
MSDDEDAAFSANRSDDGNGPAIGPKTAICKTCGLEYTLSGVNVDIIFLDMCDSCSEILKAKLKDIPSMSESTSSVEKSRSTSSDGLQEDSTLNSGGGDNPSLVEKEGHDASDEESENEEVDNVDDDANKKDNDDSKDDSRVLGGNRDVIEDESTFDVMLAAVFSCGSKAGRVTIHGHEYEFSACPKYISGRGGGTTMIMTEYSKSIPDLFGYYYYAGMYTRCYACMAFTMTECGNLFMGCLETMCNKCRVDPVIYFVESNTCRIITDRQWRRQFKLNCILMLTIDIDKAKRYYIC